MLKFRLVHLAVDIAFFGKIGFELGMSKTEALRRLLRVAVQQEEEQAYTKAEFGALAREIVEKNKKLNLKPFTKEEIDEIFE